LYKFSGCDNCLTCYTVQTCSSVYFLEKQIIFSVLEVFSISVMRALDRWPS